jgi:Carboxypeptidase regulatory-like domain
MHRVSVVIALMIGFGLGSGASRAWAQQDEDEGPMSNMHFVVVRDYNGKPIRNAAVVLHPINKKGKQEMGGLELKTDDDGKAGIDGIPYGPLRVQVLAPGFQTFGEDYEIGKPETLITVKLKRPGAQYSIYGVQEKDKKAGDKKADDPKTPDQKPPDQKPQ